MSELEDLVRQIEIQSQQVQSVTMQKQSLMLQGKEVEKALDELKKDDVSEVYKSVGPILVKADKKSLRLELEEAQEEIELRIKTLDRQEDLLKKKMKENQEKFKGLMPATGHGG